MSNPVSPACNGSEIAGSQRPAYAPPAAIVVGRRGFNTLFLAPGLTAAAAATIVPIGRALAQTAMSGLDVSGGLGPSTSSSPTGGGGHTKLFRLVAIPHAGQTVYEVFEFGCPYCRQVNAQVEQWGRTLPHGWTFEQIPALVGPAFLPMTVIYMAVVAVDPNAVPAFMSKSFALVQDQHQPLSSYKTYIEAAHDVGIDLARLKVAATSPRNKAAVLRARAIAAGADIRVTPSLVIDGRFAIDPNNADGNYGLFFQLADGLISQAETNPSNPINSSSSMPAPSSASAGGVATGQ